MPSIRSWVLAAATAFVTVQAASRECQSGTFYDAGSDSCARFSCSTDSECASKTGSQESRCSLGFCFSPSSNLGAGLQAGSSCGNGYFGDDFQCQYGLVCRENTCQGSVPGAICYGRGQCGSTYCAISNSLAPSTCSETQCTSDTDCAPGNMCSNSHCVRKTCTDDAGCGQGSVCNIGYCFTPSTNYDGKADGSDCGSSFPDTQGDDGQCAQGSVCLNLKCQSSVPGSSCSLLDPCDSGYSCNYPTINVRRRNALPESGICSNEPSGPIISLISHPGGLGRKRSAKIGQEGINDLGALIRERSYKPRAASAGKRRL